MADWSPQKISPVKRLMSYSKVKEEKSKLIEPKIEEVIRSFKKAAGTNEISRYSLDCDKDTRRQSSINTGDTPTFNKKNNDLNCGYKKRGFGGYCKSR